MLCRKLKRKILRKELSLKKIEGNREEKSENEIRIERGGEQTERANVFMFGRHCLAARTTAPFCIETRN